MKIPFSPPDIGEEEIAQVVDTLRSGWITTGPKTKELERQVAQFCRTNRAVCLNSATAALELTLHQLGKHPRVCHPQNHQTVFQSHFDERLLSHAHCADSVLPALHSHRFGKSTLYLCSHSSSLLLSFVPNIIHEDIPVVHDLHIDIDFDFLRAPISAPRSDDNFPFTFTAVIVEKRTAQLLSECFFLCAFQQELPYFFSESPMFKYVKWPNLMPTHTVIDSRYASPRRSRCLGSAS